MQVEMRTSEQRGQKKDPEALHRSRGGEEGRHCIMDYDYHGHFGNLQEVWQSCWHQKCTGLSVMYQKKVAFLEFTASGLAVTPVISFSRYRLISNGS